MIWCLTPWPQLLVETCMPHAWHIFDGSDKNTCTDCTYLVWTELWFSGQLMSCVAPADLELDIHYFLILPITWMRWYTDWDVASWNASWSATFVVRGTSASSICDVAHRLEGKRASSDAQQSLPFAQMSLHKCITRTSLRYRAWHVCASWRRFCVQTACHTRLSGTIPADMLHVVRTCIFTRCVAWLEMYELARAISSRFEPDHCAMPFEPTPTVHCVLNEAMLQGHKLSGSAAWRYY